MQKKIIALAIAAAFAAPVSAMAAADGTTFFGSMDGGLRHQINNSTAAGGTTDSLAMGQYNTARWGFKSVEDMGDGLKTNLHLETSIAPQSVGAPGVAAANPYGIIFDRQATLGLSSGETTFNMGWNYSLAWNSVIANDPFAGKFNDITYVKSAAGTVRSGNITVASKFGDVAVAGQYVMNNSSATTQPTTGAGRAVSVNYAGGPINVGGAYSTTEANAGAEDSATHMTVGGGFNFGDGKVSVGYAKKATKTAASDNTNTNMWVGASFNMSTAVALTAAYYKNATNTGASGAVDAEKNRIMAMVTYAMSKRTSAYLEADTQTQVGTGGALDVKTSGVSLGLATTF